MSIDIPEDLTAAEYLAVRNELIKAVIEVDEQLLKLAHQEASNRVVSEFRSLAALRAELVEQLSAMNAEPPDLPFMPQPTPDIPMEDMP